MARAATLIVPGRLDTRTGGYIYDRRIVEGLRERGWQIAVRELDGSFPQPTAAARDHTAAVFAELEPDSLVLIDSLALGAIPDVLEAHRSRLKLIALVHLPLAKALGLDAGRAKELAAMERRALMTVRRVVVTGRATVALLEDYGVASSTIAVVEPGTMAAPLALGSTGSLLQLICVATLNSGKGHEDLLHALANVPFRDWHLTCAGGLTRDPATVDRVRALIGHLDLQAQVTLAGDLDEDALDERYRRSDVFVLATLQETYGMAVAEALARGLPVIATATGAIPELVGAEAGILVASGDREALGGALTRVLGDATLRRQLASGAREVRQQLSDWMQATMKMEAVLESVDHG